ncbi:MAG: hypothetical protein WBP40_05445 [Candidatus Moraniibacteriota bacterium]
MSEKNKPPLLNFTLSDFLTILAGGIAFFFLGLSGWMMTLFTNSPGTKEWWEPLIALMFLFISALAAVRVVWGILNAIRNPES